jgi:type III pantothenate kinase
MLVIDAGTCVTFDFINENKYLGGAIAPDCNYAINHYMILAKLPLLSLESPEGLVGSQLGIIHSGVVNG